MVWDEDGEMMKLPTRPATWSPPNPASPTHRCGTPSVMLVVLALLSGALLLGLCHARQSLHLSCSTQDAV